MGGSSGTTHRRRTVARDAEEIGSEWFARDGGTSGRGCPSVSDCWVWWWAFSRSPETSNQRWLRWPRSPSFATQDDAPDPDSQPERASASERIAFPRGSSNSLG